MAPTNERFVSNLHVEFENEKEGNLNDVDKEFVKDVLRELVDNVNDSHHEIVDALNDHKGYGRCFRKKVSKQN